MPKYSVLKHVEVTQTNTYRLIVEADSPEDALRLAKEGEYEDKELLAQYDGFDEDDNDDSATFELADDGEPLEDTDTGEQA